MPNKEYALKFSPKAELDLDGIYAYIADELVSPIAANNLTDKFDENILRLKQFPFSCPYVDDEYLRQRGYRKLIVENYIVLYNANEELEQIEIMRILYGAMDYARFL